MFGVSCTHFLFVLTAFQCSVILFLINYSRDAQIKFLIKERSYENEIAKLKEKVLETHSVSSIQAVITTNEETTSKKKISGVAAILMLHAPTWFQRRYTYIVENTINNIPEDWLVQIFYTGAGQSQKGIDINPGISKYIKRGKVVMTVIPEEILKLKKKRYQLMTERFVWSSMLAEKVLIFGGGSVLCSNSPFSIQDFIDFDYIGAPWNAYKGIGGEGAITIRSKSLMLEIIDYELGKISNSNNKDKGKKRGDWGQEDHFFISRFVEMSKKNILSRKYKVASRNDSMHFAASNGQYNLTVLAVAGTMAALEFKEREQLLNYCPEMKIFFPVLHDPNCFGASPDSELCAKSICALKPKSERRGGC